MGYESNAVGDALGNNTEEGKMILIASHVTEDIRLLCDTVYEMECGNLEKSASQH